MFIQILYGIWKLSCLLQVKTSVRSSDLREAEIHNQMFFLHAEGENSLPCFLSHPEHRIRFGRKELE